MANIRLGTWLVADNFSLSLLPRLPLLSHSLCFMARAQRSSGEAIPLPSSRPLSVSLSLFLSHTLSLSSDLPLSLSRLTHDLSTIKTASNSMAFMCQKKRTRQHRRVRGQLRGSQLAMVAARAMHVANPWLLGIALLSRQWLQAKLRLNLR